MNEEAERGASDDVEWMHALRNASNVLGISLKLADNALQNSNHGDAAKFVKRCIRAHDQCRALLMAPPRAKAPAASSEPST